MGKKKKQKQARPVVTDVSAVETTAGEYVTSRSFAETVDLLSEGEIDGLVSGVYQYMGNAGETGYTQLVIDLYTATGIAGKSTTNLTTASQQLRLGFLRSIYWNDVPVVDKDGYYNFPSINVHQVVGGPIGTLPKLDTTLMDNYTGMTSDDVLDLSVQRAIGERLYGPEIASGEGEFPTDERIAKLKAGTKIDKYSKTYTILNKECNKIQVNIKINALFESLQAGPKTYKKSAQLAAEGAASAGYGDTKARTIEYAIYYQPIFDQRFQPVSTGTSLSINLDKTILSPQQWYGPITERVTGKIDQGYMRTTTIDLSKEDLADASFFEGWRIRIVRLTPESLTSFLRNVSFVDSIVEVYGTQLRYPYSSMIYSQFDARSFSRIPARSYDARLLKIKVPNNYDPETKTYGRSDHSVPFGGGGILDTRSRRTTGSDPFYLTYRSGSEKTQAFWAKALCATLDENNWDGNFKTAIFPLPGITTQAAPIPSTEEIFIKQWCDNPAWCFYDILTNPRYGMGEYIKEDDIDKWALYEIGQYCDVLVPDGYGGIEPRFTFNYIITSREEAFKVINDLASAFRGIAYYANGSIMAVQDKFKTPISQFTTSNVIGGDFNYASSAKKARHTVAIVRYNDKRNSFQPAVEYVEDEESVRRYGIREIETSALGCTSKGQARRFAKWILASEANETETVSFGVGMEGAYLKPGDIIQIYDNFRSPLKYSGRTNLVRPLEMDNSATENSDGEVTPFDGTNFDSVIVDQAISFKTDKLYKLDLLTPTYDYPTEIDKLDSSALASTGGFNRGQLQTVLFSGAHTKAIGPLDGQTLDGGESFRSDYLISGSGVCTQIFFNTGSAFGGIGEGGVNLGTGNKFDFTNYVITGYTNADIQGKYTSDPISESYSGGCFSGQNLIWSCEPFSADDDEFVSGNSSDYRVINIAENDNNGYSVAALAYSSGKYDDVENAIKFEGENVAKMPMFPTGNFDDRQVKVNEVEQLVFPYPNGENQTTMTLEASRAYPTGFNTYKSIPEMDHYLTLKVTFKPASYESAVVQGEAGSEFLNTDVRADESLDYAICIARGTNFIFPSNVIGEVNDTNRVPFAVNHGNWRIFETGVELYIPGKTAGSTSKYGTYKIIGRDIDTNEPTKFKIISYSAEFLIYEPDISDYHVAVFALSKEGTISDGILSKIKLKRPRRYAQSFSIANAISITNLTTESIDNPAEKLSMHPIESMEPTFGWNSSFASIFNEWVDPDVQDDDDLDEPYYQLNIAQNVIDYRITIRAPSELGPWQHFPQGPKGWSSNIPSNTIYVEFTGYNPAALSPDFAFKNTYNDPNIMTGLRDQAVTTVGGDVTIWKSSPPLTQVTDPTLLYDIQHGFATEEYFIRNEPSGYIVTTNEAVFPLREYDVVVEAHDQYGKTSSRNEVWANTIGNNEKEANWKGSTTKYDIIGVTVEPPSGLIFASTGAYDNNPFTTNWIQPYQAYAENYPYVAQAAMYPNGYLDITLQHSEGAGPDAGLTISTDQDLEKYFNNVAGLIYYFTTGDNTMSFDPLGNVQTPTKAKTFMVDFKVQDGNNLYKIDSTNNKNAGFVGTTANNFFGGIIPNAENWDVDDNYQIRRGYYLLNEGDTVDDLRIPLPKVSQPDVENIQIAIGFFDELSLLRGFEADGRTAKLDGIDDNSADPPKKKTAKIFTDRDINMSTIPLNFTKDFVIGKIKQDGIAAAGTSLFLGESSIMGAGDIALAFRSWGQLGLVSAGMSPMNGNPEAYHRDAVREVDTIDKMDWVDLLMEGEGLSLHQREEQLPKVLIQKNCVFKELAYGNGFTARYKMEQRYKRGGTFGRSYRNKYWAAKIHIQINLEQHLIPFESNKFSIVADIDGGLGITTSTKVNTNTTITISHRDDSPQSPRTVEINYYMEKTHGSIDHHDKEVRLDVADHKKINTWVPSLIKIRFGLLATNQ